MDSEHKETGPIGDAPEKPTVSPSRADLGDVGVGAMQGPTKAEMAQAEEVDTSTPTRFGGFAHEAYQTAAYETFDDVDNEVPVVVTKPDGTVAQGYVDTMIGNTLIDYKTNNMQEWDAAQAVSAGRKHGQQMQEYVESSGTPEDAKGWIISTVGPKSEEVRQAYADTLAEYNVKVKFASDEDQGSVLDAVQAAVEDAKTETVSDS